MTTNAEVVRTWDEQDVVQIYGSWNNAIDALIKALNENARDEPSVSCPFVTSGTRNKKYNEGYEVGFRHGWFDGQNAFIDRLTGTSGRDKK